MRGASNTKDMLSWVDWQDSMALIPHSRPQLPGRATNTEALKLFGQGPWLPRGR